MWAKAFGLGVERGVEVPQRRNEVVRHLFGARDVHRRGVGVVRGLAHIDVVVGVDGLFRAHHPAQHLDGAVGDHLIGVHVGLGAGPGLPHHQREVVAELAVDHLLRGFDDGVGDGGVELAEVAVGLGASALDDAERAHDRQRLPLPADLEVAERALGLGAPVAVGRHVDRAEGVGFGAGLGRRRHGNGVRWFRRWRAHSTIELRGIIGEKSQVERPGADRQALSPQTWAIFDNAKTVLGHYRAHRGRWLRTVSRGRKFE